MCDRDKQTKEAGRLRLPLKDEQRQAAAESKKTESQQVAVSAAEGLCAPGMGLDGLIAPTPKA